VTGRAAPFLALAVALGPSSAGAQPIGAGELGLGLMAYATDPVFVGLGPTGVIRVAQEVGVVANLAIGERGDDRAARGEIGLRLDLARRASRTRWYLVGGVAGEWVGPASNGYLLLYGGVERGRRGRWWVEAGLGGGSRVAAGRRWPL